MGDALTSGTSIELPWLWFGDTGTHAVEFRVYADAFVEGQAAPLYAADYATQALVTVQPYAPATTLSAPALGNLIEGRAVDVTVDLATLATGFDWSFGGSLAAVGLPKGLTLSLANPSADDEDWSESGISPIAHILGTPTSAGTFQATFAVVDGLGGLATIDVSYTVTSETVVAPAAMSRVGTGTTTFVIAGLPATATVRVDTFARGVAKANVKGNSVQLATKTGFSGIIKQRISVHLPSGTKPVTLVLKVRPVAPKAVTFRVLTARHTTQVQWKASSNATGYRVLVNGRAVSTVSARATGATLHTQVAQRSRVEVIALGSDGLTSTKASAIQSK
jgi:hypothetical protein